jgi:hypothetical protein
VAPPDDLDIAAAHYELQARHLHDAFDRGVALSNFAAALGMSVIGDRRRNLERCIAALREAMPLVDPAQDANTYASVCTNLAYALPNRSSEDPVADLLEARDLCDRALLARSPNVDAEQWAYTQINLGVILTSLWREGIGEGADAISALEEVLKYANEFARTDFIARTHHNIAESTA